MSKASKKRDDFMIFLDGVTVGMFLLALVMVVMEILK